MFKPSANNPPRDLPVDASPRKSMDHSTDKVHVMPNGDQWDVENQEGEVLATERSVDEAICMAEARAKEEKIETIIVHDGDGVTEEVSVSTPFDNP